MQHCHLLRRLQACKGRHSFLLHSRPTACAAAALGSWERLRDIAVAVLLRLPTPLPGMDSPAAVQPLLRCALALLECPRGREVDAGAQLLVILLQKYGGGGGGASTSASTCCWLLDLAAGTVQAPPPEAAGAAQADALWCFLGSALELLRRRVAAARVDMLGACRGMLAQGALLTIK